MKWNNRGHEFDALYDVLCKKKEFYLFGAGDYGKLFLPLIKDEFTILGYIDNDKAKQKSGCMGYSVFSMEILHKLEDCQGVILTISQFARASAQTQLESLGLKKDKDYFLFEEVLSVYNVYKYDRVYLSSISFLPSTMCNLNCAQCLNFNPFAKKYYRRNYEDLVRDLDLFFGKVDRIMIFHLSGGEPMLYPEIGKLIRYIDENYGDRIDIFRTVTNGTIVPNEEVLKALADSNVELTVDDYRDAVPMYNEKFEQLLQALDDHNVRYVVNKADSWVDLAPERTDYSDRGDEWLRYHFESCCQTWHELRNGRLYCCNYAAYATVAGLSGEEDIEEIFDLNGLEDSQKKELVEFRLGYTTKGYTNFCKRCRGFTPENTDEIVPAIQAERKIKNC